MNLNVLWAGLGELTALTIVTAAVARIARHPGETLPDDPERQETTEYSSLNDD